METVSPGADEAVGAGDAPPKPRPFLTEANHIAGEGEKVEPDDVNHNAPSKGKIGFLNLHHNGVSAASPDHSPLPSRKPYVPPLDLTILHQHGDGPGMYTTPPGQ